MTGNKVCQAHGENQFQKRSTPQESCIKSYASIIGLSFVFIKKLATKKTEVYSPQTEMLLWELYLQSVYQLVFKMKDLSYSNSGHLQLYEYLNSNCI